MTALIVMAKAPVPGWAKTRLIPALGERGAARLAERFLRITVDAALAADIGPVTLCGTPDECSRGIFAELLLSPHIRWAPQGDGDLGARMQRAFVQVLHTQGPGLLIGTDAPALDAAYLRAAALALIHHDTVFAPTADGGYALIGLHHALPTLFADMPWSTDAVMSMTRQRLAALGLNSAELPLLHDIDEPADLAHVPPAWLADISTP